MLRLSLAVLAVAALAASASAVGVDFGAPVQLGQTVTLSLSGSACIKAQKYEDAFIESFQKAIAAFWNAANPSATLLAGDVFVDPATVAFSCVSSHRRRQLSDSSSITVPATLTVPADANFELSPAAFTTSELASEFGITGAVVRTSAPQTVTSAARRLLADTPTYGGCYGTPAYASGNYPASYGTYGCYPAPSTGATERPAGATWPQIPVSLTVNIDGNSPLTCTNLATSTSPLALGLQSKIAQAWNSIPAVISGGYTIKQGDVDNGDGLGTIFSVPTTCTASAITFSLYVELATGMSTTTADTLSGGAGGIFSTNINQLGTSFVASSAAIGARRRLLGNSATSNVGSAASKSSPAASKNNIALGVGLGVGLGVPLLIGVVVAVILVRQRRDHQSIGPAAGSPSSGPA